MKTLVTILVALCLSNVVVASEGHGNGTTPLLENTEGHGNGGGCD